MKYTLKKLNCVQETDSEQRRDELLKKGYKMISGVEVSGGLKTGTKPVKAEKKQ